MTRFMRFRSTTTLPERLRAEPPYPRFLPVEIAKSGIRKRFAVRTIRDTCSAVSGATAAETSRSSGSPQSGE